MAQDTPLLKFDRPVLLVGPADVNDDLLMKLVRSGLPVIGADGGGDYLLESNIRPEAIIGDMDSISQTAKTKLRAQFIQIDEQDSTDFEKCLYTIETPLFLAFGFTGKRFDHTLATLHTLAAYHGEKRILLLGTQDISFVHCGPYSHRGISNQSVSIFPLSPIKFSRSVGLKYPLDGLKFAIGKRIGSSNLAIADEITLTPAPDDQETPYVITLPNGTIEQLLRPYL